MNPRGPLSLRRMSAHWVVLAAAALTTLVAAAVGAALAVFAGQALPQAVKHDLVAAPGTAMVVTGTFAGGTPAQTSAALHSSIANTLDGVPFGFWQGIWSDPLGFVAGSLPAKPASLASADTPLLQAASLQGVTDHAVLVSGRWPSQLAAASGGSAATRAGGAIPAALPASTAALLKLQPGDVLHVVDRSSDASLTFLITGLFAERQASGSAASYWQLNSVPASGSSTASGFTTYGPLVVSPSAFPGQLAVGTGTWVAQPDMADFTASHLSAISATAGVIGASSLLSGLTLTTNLPAVLATTGDNVAVARSLLGISALELLVLTVAALLAVARLLAAQREGETALLTARGATKWQLTRLTAAEVIPLSLVTAADRRGRRDLAGPAARQYPLPLEHGRPRPRGRHRPDRLGHLAGRALRCARHRRALDRRPPLPGAAPRPGRRPGPPGQAGRALRRDQGRGRPGADRAGGAGLLAAAPVLGRLNVLERPVGHRSGPRARPRARPGGRHGPHAAAAARRRPRRRPGVGGRPRAHLGAGRLAVQPSAAAPGRGRAAAGDGRRHRHAGARAARELDQVRRRPGGVRHRRGRAGGPGRPALGRGDHDDRRRAGRADGDGGLG